MPSTVGVRKPLWTRVAPWVAVPVLLLATVGFLVSEPWETPSARDPNPAPQDARSLSIVGRSRLGVRTRSIRTGFTSDATQAVHDLVKAFEGRSVDEFARLVDIDYDLDYHRLLHDLESYFSRHDRIQLSMSLLGVEPLPVGFVAEVHWEKLFRVRRTRHLIHEEGSSRLFFTGTHPPRLRAIRGVMPF